MHLLKTTEEELSLGFLEGPFFSEDQVTKFLGRDDWSLIRWFVLVQGAESKLRPIDDCLEAQLNFAYLHFLPQASGRRLYLGACLENSFFSRWWETEVGFRALAWEVS